MWAGSFAAHMILVACFSTFTSYGGLTDDTETLSQSQALRHHCIPGRICYSVNYSPTSLSSSQPMVLFTKPHLRVAVRILRPQT